MLDDRKLEVLRAIVTDYVASRMMFVERGVFGWDGPDAPSPNTNYNHTRGYNATYFDGHAKLVPFGRKGNTIPATHWAPKPCGNPDRRCQPDAGRSGQTFDLALRIPFEDGARAKKPNAGNDALQHAAVVRCRNA